MSQNKSYWANRTNNKRFYLSIIFIKYPADDYYEEEENKFEQNQSNLEKQEKVYSEENFEDQEE